MNWIELVKSAFTPYLDEAKPPLQIGEAYHLWYYVKGLDQMIRANQVALNTTHDEELKAKILDLLENVHRPMLDEIKTFLQAEGVPLPKGTPEKPIYNHLTEVPEGMKFSDEEIADQLVWAHVQGIQIGSRAMTESTRADVAAMFAKFQIMQIAWMLTFKNLMEKRGWSKVPPHFHI